jgi:gluconate 2-dehydrogenase subunit 3-like protein
MDTDRRTLLRLLAAAPAAAGFTWTEAEAQQAHSHAQAAQTAAKKTGAPYKAKFFTPHEWATVNMLVDIIIPKDDRSGSATDAGVPEFMDFMMTDRPDGQVPMRGGLAWLDNECYERFGKTFLQAAPENRTAVLDEIAWPKKAKPEMSQGVAFFNMFRDLTASGFWSSKIGVTDLGYEGNTFVADWKGCPDAALRKLGVQYEG